MENVNTQKETNKQIDKNTQKNKDEQEKKKNKKNKVKNAKKTGKRKKGLTSERFIPGKTMCRICGARMTVTGTTTTEDKASGRVYITRNLKCLGRRNHKYPLTEII